MLYQKMLAPITCGTGLQGTFMRSGRARRMRLIWNMGSDARSRRSRRATVSVTAPPVPKTPKDATWFLAIDVLWGTREFETILQAFERIPSEGRGRHAQFIPYRFEFANKLAKEHKLLLAFDAHPAVRSASGARDKLRQHQHMATAT